MPLVFISLGFVAVALLPRHFVGNNENSPSSSDIKSGVIVPAEQESVPERIVIEGSKQQQIFTSPTFETDFDFNAVAPEWTQQYTPTEGLAEVAFRVSSDNKNWSDWLEVHAVTEQRDALLNGSEQARVFAEVPFIVAGKYIQYKVELNRSKKLKQTPVVSDIRLNYLDSLEKPESVSLIEQILPSASAKLQGKGVISRAQWGSPDPYGDKFKGNKSKFWSPLYHDTKQVFIHHTVNSNIQANPKQVVRAIWHYHAITRGYGDIGYNYLVDSSGLVYEGRFGGENVRAGHTLHYNSGSIGVALLGCFDNSSTCSYFNGGGVGGPTPAALSGLTDLLAWKLKSNKMSPRGKHRFCGDHGCLRLNRIAGHRHAYGTSCPGSLLVNRLGLIRDQVARKIKNRNFPYAAERLSHGALFLGGSSETKDFTLKFRNTGTRNWYRRPGGGRATLVTTYPDGRSSRFINSEWIGPRRPAALNQAVVRPGEIGTFTLSIKRARLLRGDFLEGFKIHIQDRGPIANTYVYKVSALPYSQLYSWDVNSLSVYTDETKTSPVNTDELVQGVPYFVSASLRNNGWASWLRQTKLNHVLLATTDPKNRISNLCHDSWISCNRVSGFTGDISSGSTTALEFWIQPQESGEFSETFTLLATGVYWLPEAEFTLNGEVGPPP